MPKPKLNPGVGWVVVIPISKVLSYPLLKMADGTFASWFGTIFFVRSYAVNAALGWPGARVVKVEIREWSK